MIFSIIEKSGLIILKPDFLYINIVFMLLDTVLHHRFRFRLLRYLHFHCQVYLTPLSFDTNYMNL